MDALAFLHSEHTQLRALLDDLDDALHSTETNRAARLKPATTLVVAESQHESIEQEVFWPAVRRALGDGDAMADEAAGQEAEGTRLLQAIEDTAPGGPEFAAALSAFIVAARAHLEYEERIVWPPFRAAVGRPELDTLGELLATAKRRAPTRPRGTATGRGEQEPE